MEIDEDMDIIESTINILNSILPLWPESRNTNDSTEIPRVPFKLNFFEEFKEIELNCWSADALDIYHSSSHSIKLNGKTYTAARISVREAQNTGEGLFAETTLSCGQFIGQMTGEVFTAEQQDARVGAGLSNGHYAMGLHQEFPELVLDTMTKGNHIRKVNHSCNPNAVFVSFAIDQLPAIGLFCRKKIRTQEEITVAYGEDYAQFRVPCQCGSSNCSGIVGETKTKRRK